MPHSSQIYARQSSLFVPRAKLVPAHCGHRASMLLTATVTVSMDPTYRFDNILSVLRVTHRGKIASPQVCLLLTIPSARGTLPALYAHGQTAQDTRGHARLAYGSTPLSTPADGAARLTGPPPRLAGPRHTCQRSSDGLSHPASRCQARFGGEPRRPDPHDTDVGARGPTTRRFYGGRSGGSRPAGPQPNQQRTGPRLELRDVRKNLRHRASR